MSLKILAIDDHPDTIQLIELALQRHGYEVFGALSGPEGLEIAERERPDLILLDMMMPGMDGNAVCRVIRQDSELAATPIIMFTAKSQAVDKKDSFDAGADDYITKPTRPSELLQRIEALLARDSLRAQDATDAPPQTTTIARHRDFITVIGARGGAGATTVALNIATTIASAETETILVDLDTRQGHAALYIGHNAGAGVQDWLAQPADALDETLSDYLVLIDDYLRLLPSQPSLDDEQASLQATKVKAAATVLANSGHTVVVDLGPHRGDVVNPILQQSDLVLVCLRPERAAIVGARQLLEHLHRVIAGDKIQLLMVDYGEGTSFERTAVESYLEKSLCDVIKLNPKELTSAVTRHQPLVHAGEAQQPVHQFRRLVRQLVTAT